MNSTDSDEPVWHNTLVTSIIFSIGSLGILWNALAIFVVWKNPILKASDYRLNSFGMLCVSHSIANLGVLIVFVVWCGPSTALQEHDMSESLLGKRLGQLNIFFWDVCVYSHLAISLNRAITLNFPQKASRILSIRNTGLILIVVWCLGGMHATPYWWSDECYIAYSADSWTWNFADTECGQIISIYFDYYTGVGVFVVIMCMDLCSFYQLRRMNRAVSHGQTGAFKTNRRRIEQRFFIQTVVQGSVFFYELLNFYYIYTLYDAALYIYFTTTFAWELCHALDGLVVVAFHWRGAFFAKGTTRGSVALASTVSITKL